VSLVLWTAPARLPVLRLQPCTPKVEHLCLTLMTARDALRHICSGVRTRADHTAGGAAGVPQGCRVPSVHPSAALRPAPSAQRSRGQSRCAVIPMMELVCCVITADALCLSAIQPSDSRSRGERGGRDSTLQERAAEYPWVPSAFRAPFSSAETCNSAQRLELGTLRHISDGAGLLREHICCTVPVRFHRTVRFQKC
jgi:hypothetical protein